MPHIPIATMDELREKWPWATVCGDSITWDGQGHMSDESGHPVAMVHVRWMERALRLMRLVSHEHTCNPEGFIPTCAGCGQPWPCGTRRALKDPE